MSYLCFCCFSGDYRYETSVFPTYLELYGSVNEGIQGVVAAHTDVFARVEFSTSLTNDDVARLYSLISEFLKTESFAF